MNIPNLFVKPLSETEECKLNENYQTAKSFRIRNRSHAILLSAKGFAIDDISKICQTHRNSICRWINRWNEYGMEALTDHKRPGRPKLLTIAEENKIIEITAKNPRFPQRKMAEINKVTGKKISIYTLKALIKQRNSFSNEQIEVLPQQMSSKQKSNKSNFEAERHN